MYTDKTDLNEQDRHRKIADLQREIMMAESDLKKFTNEKMILEIEKRKLKKNIDNLRMEFQDKEKKMHVIEQDIYAGQAEISRLKKLLNVV